MNTPTSNTKDPKAAAPPAGGKGAPPMEAKPFDAFDLSQVPTTVEVPEGAVKSNQNRLLYKPETCNKWPIKGLVHSYQKMPDVGEGDKSREWYVYIIALTQKSVGQNRDGKLMVADVGDEIMVVETYSLQADTRLRDVAENPKWTCEVILKPTDKIKIGGGQTMWEWELFFVPKSIKREGSLKLISRPKPAALTEGSLSQVPSADGPADPEPPF
jgi:hypothetical protein